MTVQNHPVSLTLEPGTGYRVNAEYALGNGGSAKISVVVGVVDPTIYEAQAYACKQVAEAFDELARQFRAKAAEQRR